MGTTQGNSEWHEKTTTKIGDYGEALIRKFLEDKGYICYKPVTDGAHLLDYFIFRNDRGVIAADVKTKPSRRKYPDTGFNYRNYKAYKEFTEKHQMKMFLFFIDVEKKEIYGNYLHELDKEREYYGKTYPLDEATKYGKVIRYYPLGAMISIAKLSDEVVNELRELRESE